ncbi:unnamed protein product [Gulo gulo]|uniref:Uncharacterized protein n=1 Tax=Gulo gulo TaxID=48420 RepID=A0A9X9Q1F9_GULGU|nr:unnamed protein product [Gulo gulo]
MQMRCTNKGAWTEKYLQFQQNAACSSEMNSFDKMWEIILPWLMTQALESATSKWDKKQLK